MTVENEQDVEGLKRVGAVVAGCVRQMSEALEPGMTTAELDGVGEAWLARHGANPAPRLAYGFPAATCISVNEEVAHGLPGARVIRPGDLVHIDVSAELDGYWADTGGTFAVPPFSERDRALCRAAREALREAVEVARAGARLNQIGRAIERRARRAGFGIIRDLCGHGIGRALHEPPSEVLGYDEPRDRRVIGRGQVLAIEPFMTTGPPRVRASGDGWTLLNAPGKRSAQFEHTVIVTRGKPIVVTL